MFVNSSEVLSSHILNYENPLLEFIVDPATSKLFGPMGENAYIYETYNMTLNNHQFGISPERFENDPSLKAFFRPLSVSVD
jgi:hypothetical protein